MSRKIKHTTEKTFFDTEDYAICSSHPTDGGFICSVSGTKKGDRELLLQYHTAPHECDDPKCPGNINRQKLEMFDEIVGFMAGGLCWWCGRKDTACSDCPAYANDDYYDIMSRARALQREGRK